MPSYRKLTMLFTLAACEHAAPATTAHEPRTPEPAPVVEAEPPKPAPKQPAIIKPKSPTAYELDRKCMSRAGCRWEKEAPLPRVQKREDKP